MFRFTIRELVLVTAVVGLALGWGLDHWRLAEDAQMGRWWRSAFKSGKDRDELFLEQFRSTFAP